MANADRYRFELIGYTPEESEVVVGFLWEGIDLLSESDLEQYDYWFVHGRTEATVLEAIIFGAMDIIQETMPNPLMNYGHCVQVIPVDLEAVKYRLPWDGRPHPAAGANP